jgi:hypothetical protein
MTRTRDWLLLSGSPEAGKLSWMRTFDDLYGVCTADDGAVVHGSAGWRAVVRRACPGGEAHWDNLPREIHADAGEAAWAELTRRAGPVGVVAGARKTFSVSILLDALFGNFADEESRDTEEFQPDPEARERMFRGTLVHRLFERWDFSDKPPIEEVLEDECPYPARRLEFEPALRDIAARFTASALAPAVSAGAIQREVPFYLNLGGAVVHGVIDAVAGDGAIVIDYKTGRPGGGMLERYEFQLRLYAAAMARLLEQPPRQGVLYYADHGEAHYVDVSRCAIDDALRRATAAVAVLCSAGNRSSGL